MVHGAPPFNEKMKIEDNVLGQEEYDALQTFIMGGNLLWRYYDKIDYEGQKGKFQFTHVFYAEDCPMSNFGDIILPLINTLKSVSIWRIKANLLTKTSNIIENAFHSDLGSLPEEKQKQWTTSIFYVNTNNGYTKFEDGTKVESIANRMITFPSNMKHTGTSCTDENIRVVINFNYFEQ